MKYWFTSDLHFGHKNIIQYCNRPWKTVEDMNEGLIENWNSVVSPADTVYFLGDFFFMGKQRAIDIVNRLNGAIYWIVGNHDKEHVKKKEVLSRFEGIDKLKNIRIKCIREVNGGYVEFDKKIVLCHFPLLVWEGIGAGSWHLHGHSHGSLRSSDCNRRMDVGVDCHPKHHPFSLDEVEEYMASKKLDPQDGHDGKRGEV